MKISIQALTTEQIPFLNEKGTLFVVDYRSIWESFDYTIPAMWKYENIGPRILKNQKVLVNQFSSLLKYENTNEMVIVNTWTWAKTSIIERAEDLWLIQDISLKKIFAFIPHPAIDIFCSKNNLELSYSYKDFVTFNDKIQQKKIVTYTPKWNIIHDFSELDTIENKSEYYVKRGIGSWWYTVFKLDTLEENRKFKNLLNTSDEWYLEEKIYGDCMSIQVCKTNDECIVFWVTKQYIKSEKEFIWAEILQLDDLEKDAFLRERLHTCISELCNEFLSSYIGFLGIDFIYDKEKKVFWFLEWNIRLTAMTIPTLIHNMKPTYNVFKEDVDIQLVKVSNIVIWYDSTDIICDILISQKRV